MSEQEEFYLDAHAERQPVRPVVLAEEHSWSAEIGELVGALAAAVLEYEPAVKDTKNPYYNSKYADLSAIIAATQKPLAKHGLVVIQAPSVNIQAQTVTVVSRLAHKSGQWHEQKLTLPAIMLSKDGKPRFDAQSCGSGMSFGSQPNAANSLRRPSETARATSGSW